MTMSTTMSMTMGPDPLGKFTNNSKVKRERKQDRRWTRPIQ